MPGWSGVGKGAFGGDANASGVGWSGWGKMEHVLALILFRLTPGTSTGGETRAGTTLSLPFVFAAAGSASLSAPVLVLRSALSSILTSAFPA